MIDITKYKLVLLMYCLADDYEFEHDDLHLIDLDDLEAGDIHIYGVIHTDNKKKFLLEKETIEEVVFDLCTLYGLQKMDMDMYKDLKDRFDKGLLRK